MSSGINKEMKLGDESVRVFDYVETYGPEFGFRPGSEINPAPMTVLFNEAGMGDYINYSAACLWIAQKCPWIHVELWVSPFLVEFLEMVFEPYPNWKIKSGQVSIDPHTCFIGAELKIEGGQVINHQLLNATGAHLMDLGFAYYANQNAAPAGWTLPHLTFKEKKVHHELRGKAGTYVVFTPGAIVPSRTTTGKHLNPLIHYVKEKGLLPVFLGKNEFEKGLNPDFADDIDYGAGLDLRNKTTVCQAAAIMERAACVLGLDNGLLHLAATTDAKLIFGYNITTVAHREPRRTWGKLINLALTREELSCTACQSTMKLLVNHTFHRCLYRDNLCVDLLFADDGARWKAAIDEMLA